LQAEGLRRTPARGDVLTVLITAGAHLTAPQVHARLRDADRPFDYDYSTVLHALQTLTEHGLAHILSTGGVAAYGIADRSHHHAICTSCMQVTEFDVDQLAAVAATAERATGFTLAPHGITLRADAPAAQPPAPRRRSHRLTAARLSQICPLTSQAGVFHGPGSNPFPPAGTVAPTRQTPVTGRKGAR
jgi:Fur family ferric uptake transcriptional regulator